MSQLSMNSLSGFMKLGPQVYPERPNAVQVIQRGPHGMSFAPDPVAARLAGKKGSGFKFWVEQEGIAPNKSWKPVQTVVGLLGLGTLGSGGSLALMEQVAQARGVQDVCSLPNSNMQAFSSLAAEVFPHQSSVESGIEELASLVRTAHDPATARRVRGLKCLLQERNMQLSAPGKAERNAKIQSLGVRITVQSGQLREDLKPMIAPTAIGPGYTARKDSPIKAAAGSLKADMEPYMPLAWQLRNTDPASWLKDNWWKVGLAGAGVLALYGFAQGAGGSLFRR